MSNSFKETDLEDPHHAQLTAVSQRLHPVCSSARQSHEQDTYDTYQQPKGPTYWDNLSTLWLTGGALRELDRRNKSTKRSVTRQVDTELKKGWKPQFAPDFLRDCSLESLNELKKLSRRGGPDLSDIRDSFVFYERMEFGKPTFQKRKQDQDPSSSSTQPSESGAKKPKLTVYSRNFEQHLIDHGIYPVKCRYPGGKRRPLPNNWHDIKKRLARRRPSLSRPRLSNKDFEKFNQADDHASNEEQVTTSIIPFLDYDLSVPERYNVSSGHVFGNLAHLTNGTLAKAKPDRYYGADPRDLDQGIHQELNSHIIPSTQDTLPMVPSFFLEAKGPNGTPAVARRQACYDGALGARGIHTLQTYKDKPIYDNNAYTISSIYLDGGLRLYATHITKAEAPDSRPEYVMTELGGWMMTNDRKTFRQGVRAYRNARDWAKERRDEFIRLANERLRARCARDASHNALCRALRLCFEPLSEDMEK